MNVEAAAQALYREYDDGRTPMNFHWESIPEVSRENFRRIARLVLVAGSNLEEGATRSGGRMFSMNDPERHPL